MFKTKVIALILVCVSLLFAFSSCSKKTPEPDVPDETADNSGSDTDASAAKDTLWTLGIDTVTLYGDAVTQDDFKDNTLTVFNVWATWCGPCVDELPHLEEVSQKFKDKGVQIVGVMEDGVDRDLNADGEAIETGKALLSNAGATYTVILPDRTLSKQLISNMQYFPTTFFVNSNGEIVKILVGSRNAAEWEAEINDVLESLGQ